MSPRGPKYPIFKDSGTKNHALNGTRGEQPQLLGSWTLWVNVARSCSVSLHHGTWEGLIMEPGKAFFEEDHHPSRTPVRFPSQSARQVGCRCRRIHSIFIPLVHEGRTSPQIMSQSQSLQSKLSKLISFLPSLVLAVGYFRASWGYG